jgi:succinoglycan biosynthesis protein ExoL
MLQRSKDSTSATVGGNPWAARMLQILYLVHDLSDPAVRRRMLMLREGGATAIVAGFRRTAEPVAEVAGTTPVDLGRTRDGRFAQRLAAVASATASLGPKLAGMRKPDLIIARNLEMLALAVRAKAVLGADTPIVYECLDIHRLLLRDDLLGKAMRGAERYLASRATLLITSSPAFIRHYFRPRGQVNAPIELVENKFFEPAFHAERGERQIEIPAGPPWRIGWFGALRCSRSLELLSDLSQRAGGGFEIVLRGRPALSEFPDFHAAVDAQPFVSFLGPYRNPEDMDAVYGDVHFAWLIDFFEDGLNSKWLLPNRLYEGCRFGAVPIALAGTETAAFLAARGIGLILPEPSVEALERLLGKLTPDTFHALRAQVLAHDRSTFAADGRDCRSLVKRLAGVAGAGDPHSFAEASA